MDEQQAAKSAGNSMASREKYWDELTDAEKIERLRDEVVNLKYRVGRNSASVSDLMHHDHHPVTGELMKPMSRGGVESDGPRYRKDYHLEHGKP